jgi:5-methylcytosine-specific restriction endonuclease McrA
MENNNMTEESRLTETAYKLWRATPIINRMAFNKYLQQFYVDCGKSNYICNIEKSISNITMRDEVLKSKPINSKNKKRTENSITIQQNKKFYQFTRQLVFERDNNKCVECGSDEYIEAHHITERSNGGTDDISNMVTLCAICHAERHKYQPVYNVMIKRARLLMQRQWYKTDRINIQYVRVSIIDRGRSKQMDK